MAEAKKITRLRQIEADRVDGVDGPANGFPVLMMKMVGETGPELVSIGKGEKIFPAPAKKAVNAQGGIDEKPDIAGAKGIIVDLFKLIQSEAAEGATGAFYELYDIKTLCDAICAVQCFMWNEQDGDADDGEPIYKATVSKEAQSLADYVLKRKFSSARRKELASEGKALEDGSYPIENESDLHNAAVLARSGHGDVAAAKRLIARRAKELGVSNPIAAQKEVAETENPEVPEATEEVVEKTEASEPETEAQEDGLSKAVEDAIAKAVAPLEAANRELRDELAVLKATPIPGGPAITAPKAALDEQKLAKRAYYERQAALTENDRELSKYYANKAAELA